MTREQKRYSLSDSDMLGIFEKIENSQDAGDVIVNGIKATWNAVLAQEGKDWNSFDSVNRLDPSAYAIPKDQSAEIVERMKKRAFALGISKIGVTSALLDFMNWGPSYYDSHPSIVDGDDLTSV